MWLPQIDVLEPHFRILRYDTRGHGGTEAPAGPYHLDMLGDDAIALLDVLGVDKVHWVGLSMGGMIGQSVALNHPDRLFSRLYRPHHDQRQHPGSRARLSEPGRLPSRPAPQ